MAVLYTNNDVAGELTGDAELKLVKATRGIKTPLSVDETSNCEEAAGLVVPIPTWANTFCANKTAKTAKKALIKVVMFNILSGSSPMLVVQRNNNFTT